MANYQTYTDDWVCAECRRRFVGTFKTKHPKYCDDCRPKVARRKSAERMREKRKRDKAEQVASARRALKPSPEYDRFQRWIAAIHDKTATA